MVVQDELHFLYHCDYCGTKARSDSIDLPPPGFATLAVRPGKGVGVVVHLCVGHCLALGADNLSEGRMPNGERKIGSI